MGLGGVCPIGQEASLHCLYLIPGSFLATLQAVVSESADLHWDRGRPEPQGCPLEPPVYFPSWTHWWLSVWKAPTRLEWVRRRMDSHLTEACWWFGMSFRRLFNKLCLYLPWWGTHLPGTMQGCLVSRLPFLGLRSSWWQWLPAGPWDSPVEGWPASSFVPVTLVKLPSWPPVSLINYWAQSAGSESFESSTGKKVLLPFFKMLPGPALEFVFLIHQVMSLWLLPLPVLCVSSLYQLWDLVSVSYQDTWPRTPPPHPLL